MPSELEPRLQANLLRKGTSAAIAEMFNVLDTAIAARYPRLSPLERERAAILLIERIARALNSNTEEFGFFEENPDGSVQIKTIAIEAVAAEVTGGRA